MNKKSIIITILICFFSTVFHAQILRFGIKAGLNYANQTGSSITINSTNYKTEAITNYHFGLVSELKLSERFALQPELIYSTQGANYKAIDAINDFKNNVGYITIPLMLKINLNKAFFIDLGPQASFLLSKKNDFTIKNQNTYDFGVGAGLGIKITKSIFINARYVLGLSEISEEAKVKNSVVQASAGFFF